MGVETGVGVGAGAGVGVGVGAGGWLLVDGVEDPPPPHPDSDKLTAKKVNDRVCFIVTSF